MKKQKIKSRIAKLQEAMKNKKMAIYIIPMNDYHGSEYIGDYFKLIFYFSGFTGSAGTLVVTEEEAFLWTDGRYFLQAQEQLSGTDIKLQKSGEKGVPSVSQFIMQYMQDEQRKEERSIGFDGRVVSARFVSSLKGFLLSYDIDLAGEIWDTDQEEGRPFLRNESLWILEQNYTGKSTGEKLSMVRKEMVKQGAEVLFLYSPDEIAYLTNLRGNDIDYNPVFLSYMKITEKEAVLYRDNLQEEIQEYLNGQGICQKSYQEFWTDLKNIKVKSKVWIDESMATYAMVVALPDAVEKIGKRTPVFYEKAVKNPIECEHMCMAHTKDGVALTKFIFWLKNRVCTGKEQASEIRAAEKLEELRKQQKGYLFQSFAPIVAYADHGAIVHYSATPESDKTLEANGFLLVDTGGHYREGTTDITRTIAMGELTKQQKEHYTAVLMGNLRLANAVFKEGLDGANLDYIAREPLYRLGLDYNHGTGHGVGYLLNVHEGPNAFRMRQDADGVLKEGMITSDEPGLYLEGEYGIRLENLILCQKERETSFGRFMRFETLTMVPFDRQAIDWQMLTNEDRELLNKYHQKVYETIKDGLNEEERIWLLEETAPI